MLRNDCCVGYWKAGTKGKETANHEAPEDDVLPHGGGVICRCPGRRSRVGCTFSNNLSVTSGQYGNPLLAKAQCVKGCAFVNNRYETKPASGHGYALLGYASAANDRPFLVDGCLFKGNVVTAPGVTAAGGDYYLGLIGQNVSSSGSG